MKFKKFIAVCLGMLGLIGLAQVAEAGEIKGDINNISAATGMANYQEFVPKASILIDAQTGYVMWQDQPDLVRPIASLSKIMTAYLVLEEIGKGKIKLEDKFTPNEKVMNISQIYALSNNKMVAGVEYTLDELLYLLFIPSSNAATVMLAEIVLPNDEAGFVNLMNKTAENLGMTNTTYYNATGATASSFNGYYLPVGIDPDGDNTSTAKDLSILVFNLLKKHPNVLKYTSVAEYTVHPGTNSEEKFESYNYSLPGKTYAYQGMDGLKTGSSPSAAFGLVATVKREETRLIEVILGSGSWDNQAAETERHPIANGIFNKGFEQFEYKKVLAAGEQKVEGEDLILKEDLYGLVQKDQENNLSFVVKDNQIALKTDLSLVTDKISQQTVAVDKKEISKKQQVKDNLNNEITKQSRSILVHFQDYFLPIILGLFGLIAITISTFFKEKNGNTRRRRQSTLGRIIMLLGVLAVLVGMGISLMEYFNLL